MRINSVGHPILNLRPKLLSTQPSHATKTPNRHSNPTRHSRHQHNLQDPPNSRHDLSALRKDGGSGSHDGPDAPPHACECTFERANPVTAHTKPRHTLPFTHVQPPQSFSLSPLSSTPSPLPLSLSLSRRSTTHKTLYTHPSFVHSHSLHSQPGGWVTQQGRRAAADLSSSYGGKLRVREGWMGWRPCGVLRRPLLLHHHHPSCPPLLLLS